MRLQQYLPFTVLKQFGRFAVSELFTALQQYLPFTVLKLSHLVVSVVVSFFELQQYLPFTVLKRFNTAKYAIYSIAVLQQYLPFTVLKRSSISLFTWEWLLVATAPTVHGMRRRVRDSRGTKRRWGPHISSTWTQRRQNEGDQAIVLTVHGIETRSLCE